MRIIIAASLALVAVSGGALAQTPTITKTTSSATTTTHTATTTPADKAALSKACSDQANAKGLHGKERKKFRSDCKHGKV